MASGNASVIFSSYRAAISKLSPPATLLHPAIISYYEYSISNTAELGVAEL